MKIAGDAALDAPPERVWDALNDPDILARCIPGCQSLRHTGNDEYAMTVTAGVASIRGTYDGQVAFTDKTPPTSYVLRARGAGGPGTVDATCGIHLTADGDGTKLTYDADVIVGGMIAGVGQRMIGAVAKKMAGEFFGDLNDVLTGTAPKPAATTNVDSAAQTPLTAPAAGSVAARGFDAASMLAGAGIALVGVVLGAFIARKSPR